MADSRKYYYMKLKEDFFDSEEMILLETFPDGILYQNILMKMYCRSLKHDGRLMFNDIIPYNADMIAKITRTQVGTVEKALKIFAQMGLIEILDNGAIYMMNIQNFIGESSTEADRKRKYRKQIETEKQMLIGQMSGQMSEQDEDISPPEIENRDRDRVRDRDNMFCGDEKTSPAKPKKHKHGEFNHVLLTDDEYSRLCNDYGKGIADKYIQKVDEYCEMKGKSYKNYNLAIRNTFMARDNVRPRTPERDISQIPDEQLSVQDQILKKLRC
jgi:predicted phage replisome organizer